MRRTREATPLERTLLKLVSIPDQILSGDRVWGILRLLLAWLVICLFIMAGNFLFETEPTRVAESWRATFPILNAVPMPLLRLTASLAVLNSPRYLVTPLIAMAAAILVGANYVRDIYELPSLGSGLRYLFSSLFGFAYPSLVVENGAIKRPLTAEGEIGTKEQNLIALIGGPGYIYVRPNSLALCEHTHRPSKVIGSGKHFITRFETIKETADLEEHEGVIDQITAITKDGIEVTVRDITFRYRLHTDLEGSPATPAQSYSFSEVAIRNLVYNRPVGKDGMNNWHEDVKGPIKGVITDYIAHHRAEDVIAPQSQGVDPRGEIRNRLYSQKTRERFGDLGADLIWFDIGHLSMPEKIIEEQRLSALQTDWIGSENVRRAYAESQRMIYQELGNAEAQAELVMGILHALDDDSRVENSTQSLFGVIVNRAAAILDSLNSGRETS